MAAKTVPWWRKILTGAMRGLRAGVAAFLRPPKTESGETANRELTAPELDRPEAAEEETALTQNSLESLPRSAPEAEPLGAPGIASETRECLPIEREEERRPTAEPDLDTAVAEEESLSEPETMLLAACEHQDIQQPKPPASELVAEQAAVEQFEEQEKMTEINQELETATHSIDQEAMRSETAANEAVHSVAEEAVVLSETADAISSAPEPQAAGAGPEQELDAGVAVESVSESVESVNGVPSNATPPHEAPSEEPAIAAESAPAAQLPPPPEPADDEPSFTPAPQKPAHEAIKREDGPENSPFSVLVSQVYEGPFDLLLDLIRKQDIDIYDIPIATITGQFLAYVNQLKASDMDVAGEFIYTASLLIHIKSKMLLPREPSGSDDGQEDPRRELVERLLEHERFKNAAQMLQQKQVLEAASWTNPGMRDFHDDTSAEPEIAADTVDLVRIFRDILERARSRPILNVEEDTVTVGQMIQFLSRRLTMEDKPVALRRLLSHTKSERALIAMFLALLELVRLQAILLRQDMHFSEIFIKKNSGFDAVVNEGLARDDWQ